jgi:hypothetical protein
MYEIDYYVDGESVNYHIKSNHLPRSDDDVTTDGKNYKVISVKHVLNTLTSSLYADTLEEKFIVILHKKKMRF